jgi:hypothetical protein
LGRNVSVTLSLLSLGFKRKGKCYNGYFINGHLFHIEEYRQSGKTYKSGVYIKGSTSNKFEFDYYGKLKEVIKLQYHNKQNKIFLFKCYWYDTIDREIRVDPYHGLFKINSNARLRNVDNVFVFAKQCQQFITHTILFLERIVQELIDYL